LSAVEADHIIPNLFDYFEKNNLSIYDTVSILVAIAVFYLTYRFIRRIWQALKKMRPTHWNIWPRFGLRSKLLLTSLLAAGIIAAWQLGAIPWIGSQFLEFGHQTLGQLSLQNLSDTGEWLRQASLALYENKGTVFPALKAVLAALATYATLEVARVIADLASPVLRLAHAVYSRTYLWLPRVRLSQCQRDWLHGTGSATGGLIFGFSDLSFPSITVWGWVALAPGFFLFLKERPNLTSAISKVGLKLGRRLRRVAEFTLAHPKMVGGISTGFMIGIATAGYLFSFHQFLWFIIISGVIKAVCTGTSLAFVIAGGRGLTSLAVHTRRVAGDLRVRAATYGEICFGRRRQSPNLF
jgi:hypothetical protein